MTVALVAAGYFFGVSLVVLAFFAFSEWRFNRRVARITVGRVLPVQPPRLRVVEPTSEPPVTAGQLIDILERHRDWHRDGAA